MLREEFKMWLVDPFPNITLIIIGIYVTSLGYLEDKPLCFINLLNSSIEELNKMLIKLDTATVIPKTDNQDQSDLINSKAERANKKKEKVERC